MKTLTDWQKEIHTLAIEKGWWDEERPIPELLCLIHSEVSEALEAYRERNHAGVAEELADVVIRCLDMAAGLNIDLEAEIEWKHEFNKTRPRKHGKVC